MGTRKKKPEEKRERPVDAVRQVLDERGASLISMVGIREGSFLELWACRGRYLAINVFEPHGGVLVYGNLNESGLIKDEVDALVKYLDKQPGRRMDLGGVRSKVKDPTEES